MLVDLTETEILIATNVGTRRQEWNASYGTVNRRGSHEDDRRISIVGVGAELAVARVLNTYPTFNDSPTGSKVDYDIKYRGFGIDVKCILASNNGGKASINQRKKSHPKVLYCFVKEMPFPSYRIMGCYPSELFHEQAALVPKENESGFRFIEVRDLMTLKECIDAQTA